MEIMALVGALESISMMGLVYFTTKNKVITVIAGSIMSVLLTAAYL